ncbi:uncharacterized protein LOC131223793 [Magnolia sinica]|uniref:uncharacterized protein LOC131223793 n=1 Tax=Magnolia sinica TaxID=86752 RepID=UPI0026597A6D|nr:uncharacterized protein LOC131223793 [Magnolia sinica]
MISVSLSLSSALLFICPSPNAGPTDLSHLSLPVNLFTNIEVRIFQVGLVWIVLLFFGVIIANQFNNAFNCTLQHVKFRVGKATSHSLEVYAPSRPTFRSKNQKSRLPRQFSVNDGRLSS